MMVNYTGAIIRYLLYIEPVQKGLLLKNKYLAIFVLKHLLTWERYLVMINQLTVIILSCFSCLACQGPKI